MRAGRSSRRRSRKNGPTCSQTSLVRQNKIASAVELVRSICSLAGSKTLTAGADDHSTRQLRAAIVRRDTPFLYEHLMEALSFQGVSDEVAFTYMARHGRVRWRDVERTMKGTTPCPLLTSYWSYHRCGYAKISHTCAEADRLVGCGVPRHHLRNGRLNQLAYSLYLFIRDIADQDLVGWIDRQLRSANLRSTPESATRAGNKLVEALRHIFGVSYKVLNMALSDLLIAAPKAKPFWFSAGVNMIAIDTTVHNFLHRTGLLTRLGVHHAYGVDCYRTGGCAEILRCVAAEIDARQFNPNYPRMFPRFVQHSLWRFCAQQEFNICNGNRVNDQKRCQQRTCPIFSRCDREVLQPLRRASL
jgi:hypothetical protein